MSRHICSIIFLGFILALTSCAKRGTPDGGPKDEDPPVYVRANPENFTTNFDSREIRIFFDEYIKLENAQQQIMISPPMDPRPEITPMGTASRSIRIRINDTLEPNTTYAINFGRSIIDNNEANPLEFFQYVFSTGSYIDSLSVTGRISDATLREPDPFVSVVLYEVDSVYNDSVVYRDLPRYITNTLDSARTFQLNNLKAGTYQLLAVKDNNQNYTFEPDTDKIAFADEYITIPSDEEIDLRLFKEVPALKFSRIQQKGGQQLIFGYRGKFKRDSLQIEMISPTPEGFESRITKEPGKDTLNYWYKPQLERDSLRFVVTAPGYRDTLVARVKPMERDSLQFTFEPKEALAFNREVRIRPNRPLAETADSLIQIVNQDTLDIPFTSRYDRNENQLALDFKKEENQTYNVTVFPGALKDFFGRDNDTIRAQFRTRSLSDYGNVSINLQNVKQFPVIVQLTNEKGVVQAEKYSTGESTLNFRYLNPGKYLLRIIYDTNENGIWDTGAYLQRRQPEEMVYFPEVLDVRANWDVTQTFRLE